MITCSQEKKTNLYWDLLKKFQSFQFENIYKIYVIFVKKETYKFPTVSEL